MKKKLNLKNIRRALIASLLIISVPLFFINGQLWVINWFIIWNIFVMILFVSFMIYLFNKPKKKKKQQHKIIVIIVISYLIIAPFILAFFSFPLASYPVKHIRAEFNRTECERIVDDIITDINNDTENIIALLNWFERYSGNIHNTYGSVDIGPLYFGGDIIFDIMFCVRIDDRQPALWVLTSRCGACGEHGALFTAMANEADLQARTVVCKEIDHVWSEVKINDTWLIMEPANVDHSQNKTGYNIQATSFERIHAHQTKNITYVFAEYVDGTTEDITSRYTNLTTINISTIDVDGNTLPNIDLSLISYNRFIDGVDAGYSSKTDGNGQYQLRVGGGDIKIVVQSSDIIPLYAEKRSYYYDDNSIDVVLILQQDWTKNIYLLLSLFIIAIVFISIPVCYLGRYVIRYFDNRIT